MSHGTATMPVAADKAAIALQEKLDRILAKTKPNKREQVSMYFRDLYPKLEEHIALGKSLKDVLAAFNSLTQSNVCLRTFNDMLAKERDHRGDVGDPACCHACGQPLKAMNPDHSTLRAQTPSEHETTELENAQ
jgi:hypothetical protein